MAQISPGKRVIVSATLLPLLLLAGRAAAGDGFLQASPAEQTVIEAAGQAVQVRCDCAGARKHGAYLRCAAQAVKAEVAAGRLSRKQKHQVMKCAARSICGRAGTVTCCKTNRRGRTKCAVMPASRCEAPRGGTACQSVFSSSCDAARQGCFPAQEPPHDTQCCLPTSPAGSFLDCELLKPDECTARDGILIGDGTCEPDACTGVSTTTTSTTTSSTTGTAPTTTTVTVTTTTSMPAVIQCCLPTSPGGALLDCELLKADECTGMNGIPLGEGNCEPDTCAGVTTTTTTLGLCGNGVLDPGEQCDPPWSRNSTQCPPLPGHRFGAECGDDCRCVTTTTTTQPSTTTTTASSTTTTTASTTTSTSTTSTSRTTSTTTTLATTTTTTVPTTTTTTTSSTTTSTQPPTTTTTSTSSTSATTVTQPPTTTTITTTSSTSTTTTTLPTTVLGLAMVANPDPVAPAGLVTYELTATNRGPVEAVQVRLTLPVGTFDCGTPSDGGTIPAGCVAGRDVLWTLDTLAEGTSRTVQIVVQVRGDLASGTNVHATGRLDDAAGNPEATADTTTIVIQPDGPLALGLTEDADPVRVGDDLEYVLRFGNRGVDALLNTQLTLTLPAGTSVFDNGGGTEAPGTVTWSLGPLSGGQIGERRVRVHVEGVAPDDPLVRVARAVITSTTGAAAARASIVTQVQATALGLVLVAEPDPVAKPDPVAPTGVVTYRVTTTNRGATDAEQVQVRLTLPVGIFDCATPSDGGTIPEGCAAGRNVLWTFDTLAAGTSRVVQVVVQIRSDVPAGMILSTTARVQDAAGARARAALSTAVQAAPLRLVLTTDADPVRVGDDLEYVLRFGNRGVDALLNTQLTLTLPAGTSVFDNDGGTEAPGTVTWSLGPLSGGQIGERRVRVHVEGVAPDDPLVRVARAVITSTTGAAAARASIVTQVQATALGLVLVAEPDPVAKPDPVAPTGVVTYRVTTTNRGATDAEQVQVRLTLPVGIFDCATPSDGGTIPEGCAAGRNVLWTFDTLAAGTSRVVQVVVQIRSDVPAGMILSTTARVQDAAGARARAALSTAVQAAPLRLVLTTDADPVRVGDDLEYVLRFGNRGVDALLNTQLTLTLPAGTSVFDNDGGTEAPGTVTWSLGPLSGGQIGERRVRVHVEGVAPDDPLVRVARAVITSTTGAAAARASIVTQVQATALGLVLVAEPDPVAKPDPVAPTGVVTYRVTTTNRGATDAEQVQVRLTLPVGIFDCATPSDGGTIPEGCAAGRNVLWTFDTLAAGTSRVVQVVVQIRSDVPAGMILSTTARVQDAAGARARAALSTAVQAAPLRLVLTTDADPVRVGDDLEYVLRFGNRGVDALLNTQLTLTLPAGTSVFDNDGGTEAPGTVTWSLGQLSGGQIGERRVRVHVEAVAPDDPLVRVARAVIASGTTAARASVVTLVQPAVPLGLEIVLDPNTVAPAGLATYRLQVTNNGPGDAVQVQLRMTLPVGTFACGTLSDGGLTPEGCVAGRDVVWNLDTMAERTMLTRQAVVQIRSDVPAGTILSTTARAQDAAGSRARAALGTPVED